MTDSRRNHALWLGPLLAVAGLLSYFMVFARWPMTRDVPWLNFLLLAGGVALSIRGLARAGGWLGRIGGAAGIFASAGLTLLLVWYAYAFSYDLPSGDLALDVGAQVPAVQLVDLKDAPVDLAQLGAKPLILVFFRGHW